MTIVPFWDSEQFKNLYFCTAFRRQTIPPIGGFMYSKNLINPKVKANAKAFFFNNVLVKLVRWHGLDVHPVTGIAFYVSDDGKYGVRVYPDGRKVLLNICMVRRRGDGTEQEYLIFFHAWNTEEAILVSRAVYLAWVGPIPEGMTIDHIDGVTTNNNFRNLRAISGAENSRDGGFNTKLRNKGLNPAAIERAFLLRYFSRMVIYKETHTEWQYRNLSKTDLMHILYDNDYRNDL